MWIWILNAAVSPLANKEWHLPSNNHVAYKEAVPLFTGYLSQELESEKSDSNQNAPPLGKHQCFINVILQKGRAIPEPLSEAL